MALEGTLRDFSLADIFQLIGIQRKTGILTLRSGEETATISFINGLVVAADTDNRKLENRLGHVLVKTHRITQKELDQALEIQKQTLQRLGMVFINKGFIKQEDLRESLKVQTQEIIYRLFRWIDGDYHFQQEPYIDYDQENFTPIGAESILMEGIRMLDEWPLIERVITSYDILLRKTPKGRSVQLKIEQNFEALKDISFNSLLEDVVSSASVESDGTPISELTHEQEIILQIIDHPMQVQEIIDRSRLIEFETARALYDLIEQGYVEKMETVLEEPQQHTESIHHKLPVWIFFLAFGLLGALGAYLQWNPLNQILGYPHSFYETEPFTSFRIQQKARLICQKLDIYFISQKKVPVKLEKLVLVGFLSEQDLKDRDGIKLFSYRSIENQRGYSLSLNKTLFPVGESSGAFSMEKLFVKAIPFVENPESPESTTEGGE
jgi:hypothetical protein